MCLKDTTLSEITGARAIAELMRKYQVDYMFGMPGGQTLKLYDAMYDLQPKFTHILARDEKTGVFMADGYARFSYKPGLCDANPGPGTANMVGGLAESWGNSIPVIAITSDVNSKNAGRGVSQEADQLAVLRPFTKGSFRADYLHKIPEIVRKAFRLAVTGRPGPVHIDFPEDLLGASGIKEEDMWIEDDCYAFPARRTAPEASRVAEALKLIEKSERPAILAGGGAMLSKAWDEITELAELLMAPVCTTITGKGVIPDTHPLSMGVIGRQGYREAADVAIEESDVLIVVGCKFAQTATDNWTLLKPHTKIIQIDVDAAEIGRMYKVDVAITADAGLGVRAIVGGLKSLAKKGDAQSSEWLRKINAVKKQWNDSLSSGVSSDSFPIKPQRVIKEIRAALPKDGVFVTDTSLTGAFAATYFDAFSNGRTFYQQRGMAAIGGGLPAAIGAKCAVGQKTVFGLGGDGAFGYHVGELETAKRHNLPLVYVISNNNSLGWIMHGQETAYKGRFISSKFEKIQWDKVAEGFGCYGRTVERASEIQPAFQEALKSGLPAVVDVQVDPKEIPPISRKSRYV